MSNIDPFFIVGSERSGTTMLRLMLNEHHRLFIPKECHFISELLKHYHPDETFSQADMKHAFSVVTDLQRWKDWDMSTDALWDDFSKFKELALGEFINTIFMQPCRLSNKQRWGDQTPKYVFSMMKIYKIYPSAKFIHIVRDGRDVCVSMLATKWFGSSIRKIASKWVASVETAEENGRALGNQCYIRINYENIVTDSEGKLREITGFLGENFDVAMLVFYKNAHKNINTQAAKYLRKTMKQPEISDLNRWKNELSWTQVLVYEAVAGVTLLNMGYSLHFSGMWRIVPVVVAGVFRFADWTLPFRRKYNLHFSKFSTRY